MTTTDDSRTPATPSETEDALLEAMTVTARRLTAASVQGGASEAVAAYGQSLEHMARARQLLVEHSRTIASRA